MENTILKKNLEYISKYNPDLAKKIKNHETLNGNYELAEAQSGDPNLFKDGIPVHDNIDPEQEAIDLFQSSENNSKLSINIIYGLGLGYLFKRFAKHCKGKIILYEPNLDFLRITFELVDFSLELKQENIFVASNQEELEKIYGKIFFQGYELLLSYLNYHKHYEYEETQKFIEQISYLHGIYESNYKLFFQNSIEWNLSTFYNLTEIVKSHDLDVLENKFKNKPAVIISAGPSLNKNIHFINKFRDKVIVFCVGTALKKAVQNGITPDFLCFVEPFGSLMAQVEGIDTSGMNLIVQPITYIDIHTLPCKNRFTFYADNDYSSKWLANQWGIDYKKYENKGTVSVNALISAKLMGCNPIILIGQDLAYTGGECYAKGTIYEDFKIKENASGEKNVGSEDVESVIKKVALPKEEVERRFAELTKQLFQVKGHNGETLYAPGDYAMFIKYFEEIAKRYENEVTLINATEGGAYLDGYKYMTFEEALNQYAKEPVSMTNIVGQNKNVYKRMRVLLQNLKRASNIFEKEMKQHLEEGLNFSEANSKIESENISDYVEHLQIYKEIYKKLLPSITADTAILNFFMADYMKIENCIINIEENNIEIVKKLYEHFRYLFEYTYKIKINLAFTRMLLYIDRFETMLLESSKA